MISKRRIFTRATALAMVAAMLVVFAPGTLQVQVASAANTLPQIEVIGEKLKSGSSFTILEIIPEAGTGSIGYYVNGYEPWRSVLPGFDSRYARTEYMNNYFNGLRANGIMGDGSAFPLLSKGDYSELYPWEAGTGYEVLKLNKDEEVELDNISARPVEPDEEGNLSAYYEYSLDLENGNYVQDTLYYEYIGEHVERENEDAEYTYNATFSSISSIELNDGLMLYTQETVELISEEPGETGEPEEPGYFYYYEYVGTLGQGFYMEYGKEYYYLSDIGTPSSIAEGGLKLDYRPVLSELGDGFKRVEEGGYFSNLPTGKYLYKAAGNGDYVLEASTGESISVVYNSVQIKGGYSSNDWFLKYVMNIDGGDLSGKSLSDLQVIVRSVRADNVTEDMVSMANLIVFSTGFRPGGEPVAAYGSVNPDDRTTDISDAVADAIYQRASLSYKIPVIVDYRAAVDAADTNIQKLARFFVATGSSGYSVTPDDGGDEKVFADEGTPPFPAGAVQNRVNCNLYIYTPTGIAQPGFTAFANSRFYEPFDMGFSANSGFADIIDEIANENFIAEIGGATGTLPEEASMANAIRYIINFGEARLRTTKSSIRVLEIQGGSAGVLTRATVLGWLPSGCGVSNVEIVTMSTNEFVGKIEDLNESYDMVYIGGATSGLSSTSGLVYYNVGDSIVMNKNLAGLLDSEYTSSARSYIKNADLIARKPGNDITPAKAKAIEDFAASGYPVVIENTLFNGTTTTENKDFNVTITASGSGSGYTLTATVKAADGTTLPSGNFTYEWYRANNTTAAGTKQTGSNSTFQPQNSSTTYYFYCVAKINESGWTHTTDAHSTRISVKNRATQSTNNGSAQTGRGTKSNTIYKSDSLLNGNRIDNCTQLYDTINTIKPKKNVICVDEANADDNKALLLRYLNLSKPEIGFADDSGFLVGHGESASAVTSISSDASGHYYLNYKFTITNHTDATPNTTTYDIGLYYDQNGDGRYTDDENLSDITVRRSSNNQLVLPSGGRYALSAGVQYTLSRQIDVYGIVPWKLRVVKNGAPHIHSSEVGYAHITVPEENKSTIKVLQLLPTAQYGSITVDLSTSSKYQNFIAEVEDFNIDITVIYCNGKKKSGTKDLWATSANQATIYEALEPYDMLIIGFADCYDGISTAVANAIIQYIDSGRAVLFTHDLTSIQNVSNSSIKVGSSSGSNAYTEQAWGYNFNTILRNYASMDLYGITSDEAFNMGGYSTIRTLLQKSGLSGGTTTTKSNYAKVLEDAGFSIAYEPKSNKGTFLEYTQGYSEYALGRWGGGAGNPATTTVSQVNSGKITTYPFDINKDLTVASTHGQYYTLNLNSEEIVVWYTLSGSGYSSKNDVVNNYYIFNKGNITYSGVGHASGVTDDEAKLFINTMIAAYRAGESEPTIGTAEISSIYFFVPEIMVDGGDPDGIPFINSDAYLPFKVNDPNVDQDKTIEISVEYDCVTYDDGTGRMVDATVDFTDIDYEAIVGEDGVTCEKDSIAPNVNYQLHFPESLRDKLLECDEIVLKLTVTTTFSSGNEKSSTAEIVLRKVGLKDLS